MRKIFDKSIATWAGLAGLGLALTATSILAGCGGGSGNDPAPAATTPTATQFVFTSDPHYGLARANFPVVNAPSADAHTVSAAMIAEMNKLPTFTYPVDNGVNSGKAVGAIDFVAEGGDLANREETSTAIQPAANSWAQFEADYLNALSLPTRSGSKAPVFIIPGNHDATNAIGYYKSMTPATDATSMVEIYNRMMKPATLQTNATYNYDRDKIYFSKNIGGVHFIFLTMWPDTAARAWMDVDLASVPATEPVIIFTHDEPPTEAKHFINPNGAHDINSTDQFQNLLVDQLADGLTINDPTTIEQRELVAFLKAHKNIVAYFHGNDHINAHTTYTGPDGDISLNVFSVDSPMKGTVSVADPTKLTFQVISIDPDAKNMTVRDYQWNAHTWGASTTVSLAPRAL